MQERRTNPQLICKGHLKTHTYGKQPYTELEHWSIYLSIDYSDKWSSGPWVNRDLS